MSGKDKIIIEEIDSYETEDKLKIELEQYILAVESPELKQIRPRAIAGLSQQDLIERNVIAEFENSGRESESKDE